MVRAGVVPCTGARATRSLVGPPLSPAFGLSLPDGPYLEIPSPSAVPFSAVPRWLYALKAILAVVTLALLVYIAEPEQVWNTLMRGDLVWMTVALLLVPVNIGLEAYRWGRLVRHVAPSVRFQDALRAVVGGYPLGLLTPGRVGDYVGRAVYLPAVPPGISAALTFGERMATLASCLILGLVALVPYLTAHASASPLWPAVVGIGVLGTSALVLALLFPSGARVALTTVLPFDRARRALGAFDAIPEREAQTLLLLSLLRYGVFSTQFALLIHAFSPETAWVHAYIAVALVFFAKSAVPQVTLGDLGIRESAAIFFLGAYGVSEAAAFDASIALFGLNLLLPALAGVPLVLRLRVASATVPEPA